MTNVLLNFLSMNGHGIYVWPSYGVVIFYLALQWFKPWRQWRHYLKNTDNESNS